MQELKTYEDNLKHVKDGGEDDNNPVPAATRLVCKLEATPSAVELVVHTTNFTPIRAVVIFAEQVFPEESLVMYVKSIFLLIHYFFRHPKVPASEFRIPIKPQKNVPADLLVKVLVGPKTRYEEFSL